VHPSRSCHKRFNVSDEGHWAFSIGISLPCLSICRHATSISVYPLDISPGWREREEKSTVRFDLLWLKYGTDNNGISSLGFSPSLSSSLVSRSFLLKSICYAADRVFFCTYYNNSITLIHFYVQCKSFISMLLVMFPHVNMTCRCANYNYLVDFLSYDARFH
jgi:hypothetical protein